MTGMMDAVCVDDHLTPERALGVLTGMSMGRRRELNITRTWLERSR